MTDQLLSAFFSFALTYCYNQHLLMLPQYIFATMPNLHIDWDNLISFLTSATDKHPKADISLFKIKNEAEARMKTNFEKSLSKGGISKGFIFKFTLPSRSCVELFEKKEYETLSHKITSICYYRRDEKSNMKLFDNKTKDTSTNESKCATPRSTLSATER